MARQVRPRRPLWLPAAAPAGDVRDVLGRSCPVGLGVLCARSMIRQRRCPVMRLTDAQINRYDEDGFLAIDRLVDDATVEVLRAAYDDILEGRVRASGDRMQGGRVRQVMVPCRAHPAFRHNAALVEAMEIAGQLFGSAAFLFDMLIYKPPGDPAEVPWHQDMSYSQMPVAPAGLQIDVPTVQFWVALDDVDVENGCMHFL